MKPKVILDMAFLGHPRGIRRGAERVAWHLFDGVKASNWCDLRYVATSHLAGTYAFLQTQGVNPNETLKFTPAALFLSRVTRTAREVVDKSLENRTLPARAGRYLLSQLVCFGARMEAAFPSAWLDGAQIYHSPHTPFPPAVHADTRIRKFITCHDFIPLKNPESYPPGAAQLMSGVLACLQPQNFAFCVSESTRNDVLTYSKMPPERVFVTPLAADRDIFHPVTDSERLADVRRRYKLGEEPYFLAVSAHDPHKNFAHLIECFGRVVEAGDLRDCNLVIVGPNPGRNPTVRNAVAKFDRAAKRIRVPGFVPDEDLAALYSASLAFLFPSLAEGFGIPPLEAMQCGVPVLASNTTAIPEVIGEAGILVSPTDKDLWCAAMLQLSADANLRIELSRRSLARAGLFSWQRFIDETLRGYQASLEDS